MKKNEYRFHLSVTDNDLSLIEKIRTANDQINLSIAELANILGIDYRDCFERFFHPKTDDPYLSINRNPKHTEIAVWPGAIDDENDSGLIQNLETFSMFNLVVTWQTFAELFPEAENVDWNQIHADYLEERDRYTWTWRNKTVMYVLCGDGTSDKSRIHGLFNEDNLVVSWHELAGMIYDAAPTYEYARMLVNRDYGYTPQLAYSITEDFVDSLRLMVLPDNTPFANIQRQVDDSDFTVITWSDFLEFFEEAAYVRWDVPGLPDNEALDHE